MNFLICKENAVILILCRNSDLADIISSLNDFENTFNKKYKYPYVFLNDDIFTNHFKEQIKKVISSTVEFGQLTKEQWGPPPWIDHKKMEQNMKQMKNSKIIYGDSLSYRNMCRFFAGQFYKHDLVKKYDYYWRIEPDVKFFCNLDYDPFEYLRKNNKKYGFVISTYEYMNTIPSLWKTTLEFLKQNILSLKDKGIMKFILNSNNDFNGCHFWSNFEIASFDVFRNPIYESFFNFLDKSGGFYYERWGDAPIHTLGVVLFLNKNEIHYFDDIGYQHDRFKHCPTDPQKRKSCSCDPKENYDTMYFHACIENFKNEILGKKLILWSSIPSIG